MADMTTTTDSIKSGGIHLPIATRIEQLVDQIDYTPGSKIVVLPAEGMSGTYTRPSMLLIELMVPDSYNPTQTIKVNHRYPIPDHAHGMSDRGLIDWLHHCFTRTAVHESDEWFRDKATGEPIFDPHGTGGRS